MKSFSLSLSLFFFLRTSSSRQLNLSRSSLPVDLLACLSTRMLWQIERDRCFPFHHGPCRQFRQTALERYWESDGGEEEGREGARAGMWWSWQFISCMRQRAVTDFLTGRRYIDSTCHSGCFGQVRGTSGTGGWWRGFDWLSPSLRADLKPRMPWATLFDGRKNASLPAHPSGHLFSSLWPISVIKQNLSCFHFTALSGFYSSNA